MALLKQLGLGDNQARWLATAHGHALHDTLLSSQAPMVLTDNGHGGFTVERVPVLPGQTEKRRLPEGFGPLALALAKWAPQASLALLDVARACPADPATAKAVVNAWKLAEAEAEAGADASGMSTEEDASEGSIDVAEDTSNTFEAVSGSPDGSWSAEASASDSDDSGSEMSLPFEGAAAVPLTLSAQALGVQQGNGAHELLDAINKNALERVRKVLSNEPLLNANLAQQGSPLRVAVELGKKEIVEFLLNQNGIDVNEPDDDGFTPLHLAVDEGNADIVALFLKLSDTKVNALSVEGVTPFYLAMYRNHPKIAALLFDHGADIHQHDKHHVTPLHIACSNGNLVSVEWMMKLPAFLKQSAAAILNLNAADNDKANLSAPPTRSVQPEITVSWNPQQRQWEVTRQAALTLDELKGMTGSAAQKAMEDLMFMHCNDANLDAVGQLLEVHKVDPNITIPPGYTPLHLAAAAGHEALVNLLLKHGADINRFDNEGEPPIHCAISSGDPSMCNLLLRKGAEPNPKLTNTKATHPLALAVYQGHVEITKALLNAGARRNARLPNGRTAMDIALEKRHLEIVKLLK